MAETFTKVEIHKTEEFVQKEQMLPVSMGKGKTHVGAVHFSFGFPNWKNPFTQNLIYSKYIFVCSQERYRPHRWSAKLPLDILLPANQGSGAWPSFFNDTGVYVGLLKMSALRQIASRDDHLLLYWYEIELYWERVQTFSTWVPFKNNSSVQKLQLLANLTIAGWIDMRYLHVSRNESQNGDVLGHVEFPHVSRNPGFPGFLLAQRAYKSQPACFNCPGSPASTAISRYSLMALTPY